MMERNKVCVSAIKYLCIDEGICLYKWHKAISDISDTRVRTISDTRL
jgi:hypothetical protein